MHGGRRTTTRELPPACAVRALDGCPANGSTVRVSKFRTAMNSEDQNAGVPPRRRSVSVTVGNVQVGGDAPVVVQSMTNTDTADVAGTAKQVAELARAGSELVRITVNTPEAAAAV